MKAKVYFYEVSYTSIFVGKVTRTFSTEEECRNYTRREITPYSLGSDPAVLGIRFSEGRFYVSEEEADLWAQDGFKVDYPDYR